MDLKSGYPFWAIKNGLMGPFPRLAASARCDVAIIGAGITGALTANELSRHGHHVSVLDQRDAAWGSTAASTALIQYEIDTHMTDLAKRYGEADAALAYLACAGAIDDLRRLSAQVRDVDFQRTPSLYLASVPKHVEPLRTECGLRSRYGLDVEWLSSGALRERFDIEAPAAILSTLGATLDPYRLTYRVLGRVVRAGGEVFDRTCVDRVEMTSRGATLHVGDLRVRAKHVVFAAGYANEHWLDAKVATNRSSYAFVTDPLDRDDLGELANLMVWESARPYLYLRPTADLRLLVGGEDESIDIPARRDARVDRRARQLMKKLASCLPHLDLTPTFAWAGTFAETTDGLPFFGAHHRQSPRALFAMAYGGNGITYSMIGAGIVRAAIEGAPHPLAELFSFRRLDRARRGAA
ncbi:FAD-dependent oxidoreductase [soil metagenome]